MVEPRMSSHRDNQAAGADSGSQNVPKPGTSVLRGSRLPSLFLETHKLLEETFTDFITQSVSVFFETQRTKQASLGGAQR